MSQHIRITVALAAVFLLLAAMPIFGADKPPCDPRPLMEKLEKNSAKQKAPIRFLVFGDLHMCGSSANKWGAKQCTKTLKLADSLKPDFCVTTGDLVYDYGAGEKGRNDYKMLQDTAGWFFKKYPVWPNVGNHEIKKPGNHPSGAVLFKEFYGLDVNYSFEYRDLKFISLGWEGYWEDWTGNSRGNIKAMQWLKKELSSGKGKRIFVMLHHPLFAIGKYAKYAPNKETPLTKLMEKHNVVAVFSGHDHTYYRTKRNGVWYIIASICGGDGTGLIKDTSKTIASDVYYGKAEGVYRIHHPEKGLDKTWHKPPCYIPLVTVHGDRIELKVVSAQNEVLDECTLVKGNYQNLLKSKRANKRTAKELDRAEEEARNQKEREEKARYVLENARSFCKEKEWMKAKNAYVFCAKQYTGTEAAVKAKEEVEAMIKEPAVINFFRNKTRDKKSRQWLNMAHNYLQIGMHKEARILLEKVITKSPNSELAKEAKKKLTRIGRY